MDDDVLTRLTAVEDLPALPTVVSSVLEMVDDGQSSLGELATVIQQDAAISAALVKMANSAFYGSRFSVSNVSQALSLIGLSATIPLVVGLPCAACKKVLIHPLTLSTTGGAQCCLAVSVPGCVALLISKEDALLAGLVQDIGLLAASATYQEQYRQCDISTWHDHCALSSLEEKLFGFDHTLISATLLKNWGFPHRTVTAVELSHTEPNLLEQDLTWCVTGSNLISNAIMRGLDSGRLVEEIKEVMDSYWLPIAPDDYDTRLFECLERISELEQLFEVRLLPNDMEAILNKYKETLNGTA
ncbi:MAG: HDOD domain-containing protein [Porticoccaceae bacterium]